MLTLDDPKKATNGETTLIDSLLAEQKKLTAVERFSQQHENSSEVLQAESYRDLIPIRRPSTGEQYSFAVDLDKCTGCKACVVACHSLNGLDKNESWRDVGELVSLDSADKQTITSACHHCADPACLNGCPVGAYEKIEETGVVKHLDDQCIGCSYCELKCPYDVPKYNKDLGIVRKCDMCHDRLAEGEAPACVQSCPNGAISIQLITGEEIRANAAKQESIIKGAFQSDYTLPSTVYTSSRELDNSMTPGDEHSLKPSHKHTPLSLMLTLTQLSVGVSVAELLARWFAPEWSLAIQVPLCILAVIFGLTGLGSSVLHLGSPMGAWRAFLGLKTSWLSREIILFGVWMPALLGHTAFTITSQNASYLPVWFPTISSGFLTFTAANTVILGLISVFCSIMVYVDTKRAFWSLSKTTSKFMGTVALGGALSILAISLVYADSSPAVLWLMTLLTILWKSYADTVSLKAAKDTEWSMAKKSALIQLQSLRPTMKLRWVMMALTILSTLIAVFAPIFAVVTILTLFAGEFLQRQIYFQAVVTLKMPGHLER